MNMKGIFVIAVILSLFVIPGVVTGEGAFFIADTGNDRIKVHSSNAIYDFPLIAAFGETGLGDNQFDEPVFVETNTNYIYVLDQGNKKRIKKFHINNFTFICETDIEVVATQMVLYSSYLFVASEGRVKRFSASDLTFIEESANYGGDGIAFDTYSYYGMRLWLYGGEDATRLESGANFNLYSYNHVDDLDMKYGCHFYDCPGEDFTVFATTTDAEYPLKSKSCTDHQPLISFPCGGSGLGQFINPSQILKYTLYRPNGDFLIVDTGNHRIQLGNQDSGGCEGYICLWTYMDHFGSYGTGDMHFNSPMSLSIGNINYDPTPPPPPPPPIDYNNSLLVTNTSTVQRWNITTLTKIDHNGSFGTGDHQYRNSKGIWNDEIYFYVTDYGNDRIKKHYISNYTLVAENGSQGSGNNHFHHPYGITGDNNYLYVVDSGNNRLKKHYKSNLTYHSSFGTLGTGDDCFNDSRGITSDNIYLYIADNNNHRIKKHLKSDLSYHSQTGSYGTGAGQFNGLTAITTYNQFLYVCDYRNFRVVKYNKETLTYVSDIGTGDAQGTGDDDFRVSSGITNDGTYLYVVDRLNNRIKRHLLTDLSYHDEISIMDTSIHSVSYLQNMSYGSSIADFTWNEEVYDLITYNSGNLPIWINYSMNNYDLTNYTYYLQVADSVTEKIWFYEEINPLNASYVLNLSSICYYQRLQIGKIIPYNTSSGLNESCLATDTFTISINTPITSIMRFNQSIYDATGGDVNFSVDFTVANIIYKDCYKYNFILCRCLDDTCTNWTDIRMLPITPEEWVTGSYNGSFYPTDVDGWYFAAIFIYDLDNNFISGEMTNEENTTRLITPTSPPNYVSMDKTNYTVGDDFVLEYQCLHPDVTNITIDWESTHLLTEGIFKYDTLLTSGSLYDTFTKPGEYNVIMYSGCTQLYTKRVYVRESSNSIYIPDIIYHYQTNKDVDIIVSSITEDDLYVSIYSPDYHLIKTYEPAMIAYENGLAYIDYDLQPTDQSGLYFAHLRSSPAGTDIDTETFYARIGAYNVADGWFWDNNITQGDDMELCFYLPGNTNYSIFIKDMIGITVYMSFWNRSDINIPDSSFIRYETTSSIAIGNYTGICYNSAGTTVFNTTCKVNDDGYTPPTPTPTGIDAFINMIESAGFTGDIGKFAVAVVMILMCMYFLGRSIDSKLQIILSCLLVTAFCAIGFIPVWVLVIIGLVVAAVITFNFSKV